MTKTWFFFSFFVAGFWGAFAHAQPPNDNFNSAFPITAFPFTVSGDNFGATMEGGEPRPDGWEGVASQSVWFVMNSEFDGDVQLDTIGSDFDTMLAVWIGDSLTNLIPIARNDNYGNSIESAIFGTASSGTTYFISVYGYESAAGNLILTLTNDTKGRISGTVTDTNGVPLQNIEAAAYQQTFGFWSYTGLSTETDSSGHYTIRGLNTGTYRVVFNDWQNQQFASQAYSNAANESSGTDIAVGESGIVTNINAALQLGAMISGIITNNAGLPLSDITVEVFQTNMFGGITYARSYTTDANGIYVASGLQGGEYRLNFVDYNNVYLGEAYDNADSVYSGTPITVSLGEVLTNINVGLNAGTKVSGFAYEPDGTSPIPNLTVTAYADSGFGWYALSPVYTDASGFYQITGLAPGTYLVLFGGGAGEPYVPEYYDDAVNINDALWIEAVFEDVFTNINATMAIGGGIAGRVTRQDGVTPIENINVSLYQTNALGEWVATGKDANTDSNGVYQLLGLTEGEYRLYIADWFSAYIGEFYDNANNVDVATSITVPASAMVTNINATLAKYGSISGSVRGPENKWLLGGILVELYHNSDLTTPVESQYANQGYFTFNQLPPDSYIVRAVDDTRGIYSNQVYNGRQTLASGDPVVVSDGEEVTDIHFTLNAFSSISGRVTQQDGTNGIGGVEVLVYYDYGYSFSQIGSDVTDSNGAYTVYVMTNQNHLIYFNVTNGLFLSRYYSNTTSYADAARIMVDGVTNITGIDASLDLASRISGTVTGPDGITPLQGIFVSAYTLDPVFSFYYVASSSYTDSNGLYSLFGLSSTNYRVEFYDLQNYYVKEFYDDASNLFSAQDILLTNGAHLSDIDASLLIGGIVTGRVTATDGVSGLGYAYVQVLREDGTGNWVFVRGASADPDGNYYVSGLPAGTYRMDASMPGYLTAAYSNASNVVTGNDITLTNGELRAINFSLIRSVQISGTVRNFDANAGLPFISVKLYRANETNGWDFAGLTYSGFTGYYEFSNLTPGTYRVEFVDENFTPVYVTQSYSNGTSYLDGTSILASEGDLFNVIDAQLAAYGTMQGLVYDEGLSPTGGVRVNAYRNNSTGTFELVQFFDTAMDGSFNIGSLTPGTYRLLIESDGVYEAQAYSNKTSLALGDNISLGSGETLAGFMFVLVKAATNAPDPDSDGDGVPDSWEMQHFGSTTGNGTNMAANGVNTMLEAYIADLDPNNPTSVFPKVVTTNPPPGTMMMMVNPSSTARVYGVLWTTNLGANPQAWTLYPPEKTGTGSAVTFVITNEVPGRMYRTGVRLPDDN